MISTFFNMNRIIFTIILLTRFLSAQAQAEEKIFVHTDKEFYLAGEILWFKLYVLDAASHRQTGLSKIAYVEIVSNDQHPALQAKIALADGLGNGSFQLPFSIHSGNYIFRAYTRWMINAGPELYFEKTITILNTLQALPASLPNPPTAPSNTPASNPNTSTTLSNNPPNNPNTSTTPSKTPANNPNTPTTLPNNPTSATSPIIHPPYDVQFFPEGGSLVQGLSNRVAFRIADQSGKGLHCKGSLVNAAGDTIAHFQSLRFGMGQFSFTPTAGAPCKALLELDDRTLVTYTLPPSEDKGSTMHLNAGDDDRLTISIHTTALSGDSVVRLIIHNHKAISAIDQKTIVEGEAQFIVDQKKLPDGITVFTVLTGNATPVGERLWFRRPASLNMDLHADREQYKRREKVTLTLSVANTAANTAHAAATSQSITPPQSATNPQSITTPQFNASIAVVLQDSLQSTGQDDILNYLFLSSELKGTIDSPAYYFSNDPKVRETTDLLMMTQGWRKLLQTDSGPRFTGSGSGHTVPDSRPQSAISGSPGPSSGPQSTISGSPVLTPLHNPEYAGLLITGKVTQRLTETPASGIFAWLSVPDQKFRLASAISNKDGELQWDLGMLYGAHELVVQTGDSLMDRRYRIDLSTSFRNAPTQTVPPPLKWPAAKDQLILHSIGAQAQNAYQTDRRQHFSRPLITDTLAFYGRPGKSYRLDDYTRFTTMEEVMREYVREVRVRNSRGNFAFYVQADQANELFFETRPLVLVDGVPVSDINNIIQFDPLKIKKIEVVPKRYLLGDSVYSGIISYSSYNGDLPGFPLDRNAYILDYEGLQLHREFYSPVYDTRDQQTSRIPDLRNILYWSPDIITNASGKCEISFYTSDFPGRYTVIVQGITADGQAGSIRTSFTVDRRP